MAGDGGGRPGLSDLPAEIGFLEPALGARPLAEVAAAAARNGTSSAEELIASGAILADAYMAALAGHLGLPFRQRVAPFPGAPGVNDSPVEAARLGLIACGRGADGLIVAAAPRGRQISRLIAALEHRPQLRSRIYLTGRQSFLDALLERSGRQIVEDATAGTERANPGLSARDGASHDQWVGAIAVAASIFAGSLIAPAATAFVVSTIASMFFLLVTEVRIACVAAAIWPQTRRRNPQITDKDLPIYTLLVPLYREARIVTRLIEALKALDYPAAKLDVKLLVEGDDGETRRALAHRPLPAFMEVVTLPDMQPKTKPKALNVGLALARGALLGIFDAEDRPHPQQLREAAAAFAAAPPEVACHQARLAWYNWPENWLTRQFAIEYASLFDVLLPALARLGLPLPLGGTSNHFRGLM